MSLIERAAKRLQELGDAGAQGPDGLPRASSPAGAAENMIERAVRKVVASDIASDLVRGGSRDPLQTAHVEEARSDARNGGVDLPVAGRRQPRLRDSTVAEPLVPSELPGSRHASALAQTVELDLPKLRAAGYIDPSSPESKLGNQFRKIKRPVIQAFQGKLAAPVENANRIMITSSVPGEGKSFVALNLALSIAMERDTTVLLIDADTTRYSLSRLLRIESRRGLLDLLVDSRVSVSDALLRTNVKRLTLLPVGARQRHATELLASEVMERLVKELASRYRDRILIFDTPPLLAAPEPAVLATQMGLIIVVVEADRTTHKVLTNALSTIRTCPMVTTVLNKTARDEAGYYYEAP